MSNLFVLDVETDPQRNKAVLRLKDGAETYLASQ